MGDVMHGTTNRRHCMVVHNSYPMREPRVEREAKTLASHGYEVDVICLQEGDEPRVDREHGVRIYRLPVKRHKGRGAAVQLLEYLAFFTLAFGKLAALHRTRRYAVVQIHNLPDFLVFAGLIPKLTGARVILDIHDVMPEFYASRFNRTMASWPVRLIRWQEQLSCRFADHVITVSDLWQTTLINRGLPAQKISVVMNVADDRVFQGASPVDSRSAHDSRFRLMYHGTLTRRYGIDLLIRAIDRVRHVIPEIHLTIHGVGEYGETLRNLARELKLDDHIQFSAHFIPTPELPAFIRQADLAVVPYRRDVFTDGILPTKLMEYAALGVPVIAARTPAIEAYFDATMVEFFTPDDSEDLAHCILRLHKDHTRRAMLAQNADAFNQRYDWTSQAAGYLHLVNVLGSR